MKIAARKSTQGSALRRDQFLSDRTRAAALRDVFPDVEQLSIELQFSDVSPHTPSPQQHTLYPAAPAFFRFVCPCADCDGDFDLTEAVMSLVKSAQGRKRAASSRGQMNCLGHRLRDRDASKPCSMQMSFQLISTPRPGSSR